MKILDRLPIPPTETLAFVGTESIRLKETEIIVWVSLAALKTADWNPATDPRLTAWEVVHQLIHVLEAGGESATAALVAKLGSHAETARELAYRLYTLCERKKCAPEALSYNGLVQSWPEIQRLARDSNKPRAEQPKLFE